MDGFDPGSLDEMKAYLMRQRPYASFYDWHDRKVQERGIVTEFVRLMYGRFSDPSISITSCQSDPPDCVILVNDTRIAVEVTELVDRDFLERVVRAKEERGENFIAYDWAEWTRDKFFDAIKNRLCAKAKPKEVFGGPYSEYFLLIHTAEPGLDPNLCRDWLTEFAFRGAGIISSADILFDYRPGVFLRVVEIPLADS